MMKPTAPHKGQPAGDFCPGQHVQHCRGSFALLLARYHKTYPMVNLQVQSAPSGELLEGLITGRLDAAFVDGPLTIATLDGVPLCEERLVLICEADHPPVRGPRMWRAVRCSRSGAVAPTARAWKPGFPTSVWRWGEPSRSSLTKACSPA